LCKALELPEYLYGMFPVACTGGAEFIEDLAFLLTGGFLVSEKDSFPIFFS
jgi:hypothetical protein